MCNIPENVKKCVTVLKASKSDTEKFAALFIVTKLVKADCDIISKKLIFEAIGSTFFQRLLLSSEVPADCPPLVYKSVALAVLSSLCGECEIATHPEMLANIPSFLAIVQQADDEDMDDNLIVVNEAYECLHHIAEYEDGQRALLDSGAINVMCEIYTQQSFQADEALKILVQLVGRFGVSSWDPNNPKPFHAILNKISLDFETDNSKRKFELGSILHALLISCSKDVISRTADDESWPTTIYKCLVDILTSRINKQQRDPTLKLASVLIETLGWEWCLSDEERSQQFFLLLLQLSSIEIRMQLEDKSMEHIIANAELIIACFIIIENYMIFMAAEDVELGGKEKQQILTALKGAFDAVINLMNKIFKDKLNLGIPEKVFVVAMIRGLSAWLAQETSGMRNAIYALLPHMLAIANESFYAFRARKLSEKEGIISTNQTPDPLAQTDALRVMLPAFCHLTVEEPARKILLENKQDEILFENLSYHWSIVRPKVPKSEIDKTSESESEMSPQVLNEMQDSRTAMISLCNIFMNIIVLEGPMVEESHLYASLLKFIFDNLPELKNIPENLVLHGNLAILGLLLLKQQSKRVKKKDFSNSRYVQSTIRFLRDAFNVDESSNNSLAVSMAYKEYWMELMELWFLGMQAMSAVLTLIPWVSEFAIESGWAQGIINTLLRVKMGGLPPNTKSAYENFLCQLVDANNMVASVLKERDALTVCRTHRFIELGKRLFSD